MDLKHTAARRFPEDYTPEELADMDRELAGLRFARLRTLAWVNALLAVCLGTAGILACFLAGDLIGLCLR